MLILVPPARGTILSKKEDNIRPAWRGVAGGCGVASSAARLPAGGDENSGRRLQSGAEWRRVVAQCCALHPAGQPHSRPTSRPADTQLPLPLQLLLHPLQQTPQQTLPPEHQKTPQLAPAAAICVDLAATCRLTTPRSPAAVVSSLSGGAAAATSVVITRLLQL